MDARIELMREFIKSETGYSGDIHPETDLLEHKILDSFNIVTLATFIQERFDIELEPEDLVRANLSKLSTIAHLIERKKGAVGH